MRRKLDQLFVVVCLTIKEIKTNKKTFFGPPSLWETLMVMSGNQHDDDMHYSSISRSQLIESLIEWKSNENDTNSHDNASTASDWLNRSEKSEAFLYQRELEQQVSRTNKSTSIFDPMVAKAIEDTFLVKVWRAILSLKKYKRVYFIKKHFQKNYQKQKLQFKQVFFKTFYKCDDSMGAGVT